MKKTAILLTIAILFSANVVAQDSSTDRSSSPRFIPGDLFYPVESFVEDLEVRIAGLVGGPDFKSKAIANNADEALKEAKLLADNNRSSKAAKMAEKYSNLMNRSQSLASESRDRNLSEKLQNLSEKNVRTLKQVKKKLPEQARKGINKAINNSRDKNKAGNPPETDDTSEKNNQKIQEDQSSGMNTSDLEEYSGQKNKTIGNNSRKLKETLNNSREQTLESGETQKEPNNSRNSEPSAKNQKDDEKQNQLTNPGSELL